MTKIKQQLKNVLDKRERFTKQNELAVLARIQKEKRTVKIPFILISFVALTILFIALISRPNDPIVTASEASLFNYIEQTTGQGVEVLYKEMGVQEKNDAIVVYQLKNNEQVLTTEYVQFHDNKWQQVHSIDLPIQAPYLWQSTNSVPYLTTGIILNRDVKTVLVGEKEAQLIELNKEWLYYFSFSQQQANRVVVKYSDGNYERLQGEMETESLSIPYASMTSNTQTIITYLSDTMDQGKHDYTAYPIVVDSKINKLQRKDVMLYENVEGQNIISRIIGLPGERLEIQNGTVVINQIPYNDYYGYAKIGGEQVVESYIEKVGNAIENEDAVKALFDYTMPEILLNDNEVLVVPDNWMRGKIEVISLANIKGQVLGYEASTVAKKIWTDKEIQLYNTFKDQYNSEVFRDESPITIARVYLYASFLHDEQTVYRLLTTRENYIVWSEEEHMKPKPEIENQTASKQAVQNASSLLTGEFKMLDDYSGYIDFVVDDEKQGFQMILNESGIWQVAFMPMQ